MAKRYTGRNVAAFKIVDEVHWIGQTPSQSSSCPEALRSIYAAEKSFEFLLGPPHAKTSLALDKWRLIHRLAKRTPHHPNTNLSRGDQWREMRDHWISNLPVLEVIAWIGEQAEIADNIAAGIQDLRPRKNGPCQDVLMEYLNNRKRKALSVHRFNLGALASDPSLDWTVTDEMIKKWKRGEEV